MFSMKEHSALRHGNDALDRPGDLDEPARALHGSRPTAAASSGVPSRAEKDRCTSCRAVAHSRFVSAAEALSHVRSGQHVFVGSGCAEPELLVRALTARASELHGLRRSNLLDRARSGRIHRGLQY